MLEATRPKSWHRTSPLSVLAAASDAMTRATGECNRIEAVLAELCACEGLNRAAVAIVDRVAGKLTLEAAHNLDGAAETRFDPEEGIAQQVVGTGEAECFQTVAGRGDATFVASPVRSDGEVLGVLMVEFDRAAGIATSDSVQVFGIVATMMVPFLLKRQRALAHAASENPVAPNMVARAKSMKPVFEMIEAVADSDATVLIRGESGTGKELVADAIHLRSRRRDKPLIKVNCAALAEGVLESELFGHEAGAFSGAIETRIGRFEAAHGGTIFLDEIGDFRPSTQVTLLRILQQQTFERVGGTKTLQTDVRVVAATNRDLEALMAKQEFREDLYYRLNVFPIHVPPLRERRADILLLADIFVERFSRAFDKDVRRIASDAIDLLTAYHWPGNVRELENCIERATLLARDGVIHARHLPPTLQTPESSGTSVTGGLTATLSAVEKELLVDALKDSRGNMAEAARQLGITERQMGLRVRKYGLKPKQ